MTVSDLLRVVIVLGAVAGLLLFVDRLGRRLSLPGEVRRKLLHLGNGALGLSLPWLFDSFAPVAVVCTAGLGAAVWLRRTTGGIGQCVHGVARSSLGDLLFPVAVAVLWLLAGGDRVLFLAPLLVLTVADSGAALAGIRYGLTPYPTLDGTKTLEGTVVFCAIALVVVLVPMQLLSTVERADVLLVACVVALVAALIEAASPYGLDNLLVPLGVYSALRWAAALESAELAAALVLLGALAASSVAWLELVEVSR